MKCPNCYREIPPDSKFCPDCGCEMYTQSRLCSSIEEFEKGDIIINGITLGLTNRRFFTLSSEFEQNSLGFYNVNSPRIIFSALRRNVPTQNDKEFFNQPIDTKEFINEIGITNSITIFSDYIPNIPFLSSIHGLFRDKDNYRIAENIEDNNYVIIENITPEWPEAAWLVSKSRNSLGNFVFIMVRNYIEISQNVVAKCINIHTKQIIYCR